MQNAQSRESDHAEANDEHELDDESAVRGENAERDDREDEGVAARPAYVPRRRDRKRRLRSGPGDAEVLAASPPPLPKTPNVREAVGQEQIADARTTDASDANQKRMLELAAQRLGVLVRDARAARVRDTAEYVGPQVPRDTTRRDQLLEAACRSDRSLVPSAHRAELGKMDADVQRIAIDVVNNPLWIASDYLERNLTLENAADAVKKAERVRAVERAYERAERELVAIKTELDAFDKRRGSWGRTFEQVMPAKWRKRARLHAKMIAASEQLVYGKVERDAMEAEVRAELEIIIGERNLAAIAKQQEARNQRDHVERHLREAMLQRHVSQKLWDSERTVEPIQRLAAHEPLEYVGPTSVGPYQFQEFRGTRQRYLADNLEVRDSIDDVDLARGDRVLVTHARAGQLSLEVSERGDVWSGSRDIAGQLIEIDRMGDKVRGLKLRDLASKHEKWVRPREGDDLGSDFSAPLLRGLEVGDTLRIDGRSMFVRPAAPRGRGR